MAQVGQRRGCKCGATLNRHWIDGRPRFMHLRACVLQIDALHKKLISTPQKYDRPSVLLA
jgi:hypothetical protein